MRRRAWGLAVAAAVAVAGCSESTEPEGAGSSTTQGSDSTLAEGDTVLGRYGGEEWFLGTLPNEPTAADPDAAPIVIGLINQEDTPLGSYPEIRRAVEAAVEFVNAELGGVDGHPLELKSCITSFNPEQSATCAQELEQAGVVAMVGGLDVTSNGSVPVLEQNGIAQVGGIPANLVEQRSDVHFFLSGGVTGALAAFLAHTAETGGERAVLAYGEFESFAVAANDYAAPAAKSLGVDLETISFPLTATDYLPVLTRAASSDPDSIIIAAAGASCVPIMRTYRDLEIAAQLYLVGACADPAITSAADGAQEGIIFNSEGPPIGQGRVDGEIYLAIDDLYADDGAGGAGTVGVRSLLNLYAVLDGLGFDGISRDSILETMRAAVDQPSFWGHPYTCDQQQVAGLPALCAPQQSLVEVGPASEIITINDEWYDTVAIFAAAL